MTGRTLAAAFLLALTACTPTPNADPPPTREHRVTLNDGRVVTCLLYERGLSCDWAGAR